MWGGCATATGCSLILTLVEDPSTIVGTVQLAWRVTVGEAGVAPHTQEVSCVIVGYGGMAFWCYWGCAVYMATFMDFLWSTLRIGVLKEQDDVFCRFPSSGYIKWTLLALVGVVGHFVPHGCLIIGALSPTSLAWGKSPGLAHTPCSMVAHKFKGGYAVVTEATFKNKAGRASQLR